MYVNNMIKETLKRVYGRYNEWQLKRIKDGKITYEPIFVGLNKFLELITWNY